MFVVKLIFSHLVCASRPVEQLFIHSGWNARSLVACLDRPSPPAARQKVCDPALSAANYVDVPVSSALPAPCHNVPPIGRYSPVNSRLARAPPPLKQRTLCLPNRTSR
ncbi:unnamed protein product [Arctia plantaginis]|uniref:Uncharacterized protein n=1 Tax=Arctia plantaginis TaxID=874455 RepID=A0A8S0Z0G3_ARCPL|nr:unnamed protein product [Arctia plantaginis]